LDFIRRYAFVGDVLTDCVVITWAESANSQVYGGRKSPLANTVETCQAACVDNSVCTGLDWDPTQVVGERCWLHGPWSETEVHSATGVTHYNIRRTDTCNGTLMNECFLSGNVPTNMLIVCTKSVSANHKLVFCDIRDTVQFYYMAEWRNQRQRVDNA